MLTIKVNMQLCTGHARCGAVAPTVYRLDDNGYCAADGDIVPAGSEELARRGARACPEAAIKLIDNAVPANPQESSEMHAQQPRDIAIGFFNDVGAGRFAEAWDRLSPDLVYDIIAPGSAGGRMDKDGLAKAAATLVGALREPLRLEVKGVTCENERVAIEVESHSVNKSGMLYNNRYHFLFVVRDGKIVEGREYLDSAHYLEILKV